MLQKLFQNWTTVHCSSPVTQFVQNSEDWLDLKDFADATFWVDVSDVVTPTGSSVSLVIETSPTIDDSLSVYPNNPSFFVATTPPLVLSPATSPAILQTVASVSTAPLARFIRWRLLLNTGSGSWGATFRIRVAPSKQSHFVPTALPGCVLWVRADLGLTAVQGTTVSAWPDQSGNGHSPASSTGPTYDTGTMGVPSLFCASASNSYLATGSVTLGANATIFAAVRPTSPVSYGRIIEQDNTQSYYLGFDTSDTHYQFIVNDNTSPYGTAVGGSTTPPANTVVTGLYSSATGLGTLYVNGIIQAAPGCPFTTPANVTKPIYLMTARFLGSYYVGYFAEAIIYNRALSTSDLQRVHNYLLRRYGIS